MCYIDRKSINKYFAITVPIMITSLMFSFCPAYDEYYEFKPTEYSSEEFNTYNIFSVNINNKHLDIQNDKVKFYNMDLSKDSLYIKVRRTMFGDITDIIIHEVEPI